MNDRNLPFPITPAPLRGAGREKEVEESGTKE